MHSMGTSGPYLSLIRWEDAKADMSLFFFFLFFDSVLRPFKDYFTHIEMSQLVGGAKQEYTGKTT